MKKAAMGVALMASVLGGCAWSGRGISWAGLVRKVKGPSDRELLEQIESPDADLRRAAIERLSRKKAYRRGPWPGLYAVKVKDEDATVRVAALRALAQCGEKKYLPDILAALKCPTRDSPGEPDPAVRRAAAVALDSLYDDRAAKPLMVALRSDQDGTVRAAAARALRHHCRRKVLEALVESVDKDGEFLVQYNAAEALRELTGRQIGTDAELWRRAIAGGPQAATQPAAQAKRPWWDFFGLTQKKRKSEKQ
ncbi:MAG: hypothetical protein B1H04_00765 [Planctomycetales bacterium 4484_123]|nr:MAG: hypothetical protein B1H04_00765 [Planctomycetales bacterium 4484_123]